MLICCYNPIIDFWLPRNIDFGAARSSGKELSRRRSFVRSVAALQRAAAQAARARERAQAQAIRAHQRILREQERARIADGKEQLRLFHHAQEEEVSSLNCELAESIEQITSVLHAALGQGHRLDFEKLKSRPEFKTFDPGALGKAEDPPRPEDHYPRRPGFFAGFIPGAKTRHQLAIREA